MLKLAAQHVQLFHLFPAQSSQPRKPFFDSSSFEVCLTSLPPFSGAPHWHPSSNVGLSCGISGQHEWCLFTEVLVNWRAVLLSFFYHGELLDVFGGEFYLIKGQWDQLVIVVENGVFEPKIKFVWLHFFFKNLLASASYTFIQTYSYFLH